jgi:hypothetical protein
MDDAQIGEPAVAAVEREPVPDEEVIGHGEPHVSKRQVVDEPPVGPVQKAARGDVPRFPQLERLHEVVQRQAGVDDVLDDQDVPLGHRQVEILDEPDLRAPAERAVVGGEADEVERVGAGDRPRQVGEEDERALENRDQDGLATRIIGGDLAAQLDDTSLDLVAREIDLSDPLVERLYEARFSLYFWARRSKSRRVKSLILISGYLSRSFRIFRFLRVTSDCFITVTSR